MRAEVRVAGFGGQGVITIGAILGRAAALYDGKESVLTKDYGPEKTGGWSKADLVVSDKEVHFPLIDSPTHFICLSQDGFERYRESIRPDALAFFEASLVKPDKTWKQETLYVPAIEAAMGLGKKVVANTIMLGAFAERAGVISVDAAREAVLARVPKGTEEINLAAFEKGRELARDQHEEEVTA